MSRRRSSVGNNRMFQGLFVVAWLVFLFFMLGKYFRKSDETVQLDELGNPIVETDLANADPNASQTPESGVAKTAAATGSSSVQKLSATPSKSVKAKTAADAYTAVEILQQVRDRYASASAYSDNGLLYLHCEFDDSPSHEQYAWETRWQRDGRFSGTIFNTKVNADNRFLSCVVRDFETRNLDGQQLFLDARAGLPIRELYSDPIANYYLNGGERIPVNANIVPSRSLLAPPALALLTKQTESPWLTSGVSAVRMENETLNSTTLERETIKKQLPAGKTCFVVKSTTSIGDFIFWIEEQSLLIQKIKLPTRLLDPMLISSPAIRNSELIAKFPAARFATDDSSFETVTPVKDAFPVNRFVRVPEELPTTTLGTVPPEFSFKMPNRSVIRDDDLQGKPIAMLWVSGGEEDAKLIADLVQVQENLGKANIDFAVAVPTAGLQPTNSGAWMLSRSIQTAVNLNKSSSAPIQFLVDDDGQTQQAFDVKSLPTVVLLDEGLKLQYAKQIAVPEGYNGILSIDDRWAEDLTAAIASLQKGRELSVDMLAAYRDELNNYFEERERRSVAKWLPGFTPTNQSYIAAVPAKVRREETVERAPMQLNPKLIWKSDRLQTPGNIALLANERGEIDRLAILDGWQTAVVFGVDGSILNRKVLSLPKGVGVSAIRPIRSASGEVIYAMFSRGGQKVYFFDKSFAAIGSYPSGSVAVEASDSIRSILDCQIVSTEAGIGGSDQLLIFHRGTTGTYLFDPMKSEAKRVNAQPFRSAAVVGKNIAAIDDQTGSIVSLTGDSPAENSFEYSSLVGGANGSSMFAATGMNRKEEWSLVGLDSQLKTSWNFPIGSAVFRNDIEPVSGAATTNGTGLWAVADADNRIYLLSGNGKWLGDFDAGSEVRGLCLVPISGRTRLIVSTESKVECWGLNFVANRVGVRSN